MPNDNTPASNFEQVLAAYETIKREQPWSHPASSKKHQRILPSATFSPWLSDADFVNTYEKITQNTVVDIYRCYELWILVKQLGSVDGDILEVGVWRGGTGAVIAEAAKFFKSKKVYLADTFSGVVKAGVNDPRYTGGEHADTSLALVKSLFEAMNLTNAEFLPGTFPEDTQHKLAGKISMLHCDVDVYESTKDIVEWCLPRLSTGSILVFDDYGFDSCEGVTIFCDEFRMRQDFTFIYNLNGHAIFIKK